MSSDVVTGASCCWQGLSVKRGQGDTVGNPEQEAYFASTRGQHVAGLPAAQGGYSGGGRGAHAAPLDAVGGQAGGPPAGPPVAATAVAEQPAELMYLQEIRDYMRETRDASRQTKSAVVFIAWVVGVVCAVSLILGIIAGVQLAKVNRQLSNLGGASTDSNCMSQGGTDPSC